MIHLLLLSIASLGWASNFRQDACVAAAEAAVYRHLPALRAEAENVRTAAQFDCGEAALIRDLDRPAATANAAFERTVEFLEKLPLDFTRRSLDYVTPYCRTDSAYYGPFCMASDIEAAKDVFRDPELLGALPGAVRAVAEQARREGDIDLVRTVSRAMPARTDRYQAVRLAAFLGLDDNGVQSDRLKADLLWAGRYDDYALVFVPLSQYISGRYSDYEDGAYFPMLLFATRTGKAVFPGSPQGEKKTSKAFAAMYLGCKLGRDGFNHDFINAQAGSLGFFYEAIKARDLSDVGPFMAKGFQTARLMKAAADYGQSLCR